MNFAISISPVFAWSCQAHLQIAAPRSIVGPATRLIGGLSGFELAGWEKFCEGLCSLTALLTRCHPFSSGPGQAAKARCQNTRCLPVRKMGVHDPHRPSVFLLQVQEYLKCMDEMLHPKPPHKLQPFKAPRVRPAAALPCPCRGQLCPDAPSRKNFHMWLRLTAYPPSSGRSNMRRRDCRMGNLSKSHFALRASLPSNAACSRWTGHTAHL